MHFRDDAEKWSIAAAIVLLANGVIVLVGVGIFVCPGCLWEGEEAEEAEPDHQNGRQDESSGRS